MYDNEDQLNRASMANFDTELDRYGGNYKVDVNCYFKDANSDFANRARYHAAADWSKPQSVVPDVVPRNPPKNKPPGPTVGAVQPTKRKELYTGSYLDEFDRPKGSPPRAQYQKKSEFDDIFADNNKN